MLQSVMQVQSIHAGAADACLVCRDVSQLQNDLAHQKVQLVQAERQARAAVTLAKKLDNEAKQVHWSTLTACTCFCSCLIMSWLSARAVRMVCWLL